MAAFGYGNFGTMWVVWFGARSLGALLIVPPLLTVEAGEIRPFGRPLRALEAFLVLALVGVVAAIVFGESHLPLLFMIMPPLVLAAIRLGFLAPRPACS